MLKNYNNCIYIVSFSEILFPSLVVRLVEVLIGNRMEMKNREMQSVLLSQLKTHLINMLHCQDVRVTTLAVRSIDMMRRHGLSLFMRSQGNHCSHFCHIDL